jgi:nucleoside-diphosphate-sugar epimerase
MDVLLIGGSGFVSGTVARLALAAGHRVWAVTRGQRAAVQGVTPLVADRKDAAAFAAAITGARHHWDLAIDCIGYLPDDARQDMAVLPAVADWLAFISTDFTIDPAYRSFPRREDAPLTTAPGYGYSKCLCEEVIAQADAGAMGWTIVRPCHIYGPGSQLGCMPLASRDPQLLRKMRAGEAVPLIGGGHFLQQPIFAEDLARLLLACPTAPAANRQIVQAAGPDIVASHEYYRLIAEVLGVPLRIAEVGVAEQLAGRPELAPFLCHRVYDLGKLDRLGLPRPATPLAEGLRRHVAALLTQP